MSKPDENEDSTISLMHKLCMTLAVDKVAAKKAKDSYFAIKKNYTLGGDPAHWVACALYVACRTSRTPTVQVGKVVESNCVSLTKLLRLCNLSLIQFFNKIKNWMEMASMSLEFKEKISHLEHKFAVTTMLYRKFQPIFQEIFSGLTNDPLKAVCLKSKRQKLQPCSTNALFEFTWCLYVCVKGQFRNSADDLVDMYHVLLSCLDYIFGNAFMSRRRDLINHSFKGLPDDWLNDDFEMPSKPPCIISTLCEIKDGLTVEATTMKEYKWTPIIQSFFDMEILKGNSDNLMNILDTGNFEANLKSLNNLYETYVLSVGEFDERIFLGEHGNDQIETCNVSRDEISEVIATFGPSGQACPDTPLTGRRYLNMRREELTPVSKATNSVGRIVAFLRNCKPHPSPTMMRLFNECGVSEETVKSHVIEPCNQWMEQFANSLREAFFSEETIAYRCNMVHCLYYKIFEHIIKEEHRRKPHLPFQVLASEATYQRSLFACCCEVVVHVYGVTSLRFPRVLQVLRLPPYHFYKIIELVVQALVDKVARDLIKHLNAVEEEVLESLVWKSDSPLWDQLADTPVPASAEVYGQDSPNKRTQRGLQSSMNAAMDFQTQSFNDNIKPGQSLLVKNDTAQSAQSVANENSTPTPTTPKKNNSLILFFRKFYSLAVVRMNDLCTRLQLTDEGLKLKVWTCLEYSIMHQTHLLRDRYLDQILMCAVYVICKVSNEPQNPVERTFAEIMRCYRQRPLADSHVYRSVLLKPAVPATADQEEVSEQRGDLINFYNVVYVQCMQTFALRFNKKRRDECSLSPLPAARGDAFGAGGTRVSERHQLYVKPFTTPPPNNHHLTYRFSRSPAKDLHAINSMVSCEESSKRRAAGAGSAEELVKRSRYTAGVARKLHGLMNDRQAV